MLASLPSRSARHRGMKGFLFWPATSCQRPVGLLNRLALCVVLFLTPLAHAQKYPSGVVRIVVPYAAGASTDVLARSIGDKLGKKWGASVIVENIPGAGGNIGARRVFNSKPDGHTLMMTPPLTLVVNDSLYKNLRFDPSSFEPVTMVGSVRTVLVANPKVEADTLEELISYLKRNPGKINYASQGIGSSSHLAAELFKFMGKVDMVHVPYNGASPALTDLVAGHVDVMFANLASALPLIKSGRLKALAVGGESATPDLPNIPTVSTFFPGFAVDTWYGMVAPPKTPHAITAQISAAVAEILKDPDIVKRLDDLNTKPIGNSPQQMEQFLKRERAQWREVIAAAGMTMQ